MQMLLTELYVRAFVWLLAGLYIIKQFLMNLNKKRTIESERNNGGVCIVTGGCGGIGLEVSRYLVRQGMHVIIASLKQSEAAKKLQQDVANSNGKVEFCRLDLSSMKSVRNFAKSFLDKDLPLDLLVNNAGIMLGRYKVTDDGFESQMAINYFGHFLLTHLLLPKLIHSGSPNKYSRIINISSCCHYAGSINLDDMNSKNYYSCYWSYAQSKLAIVTSTMLLDKYLREKAVNVTVNAVHPGVVKTNLYCNSVVSLCPPLLRLLLMSPEQAALDVGYVCVSSEFEGVGGKYVEYCSSVEPNSLSNDEVLQIQLWKETCKLLDIDSYEIGANG